MGAALFFAAACSRFSAQPELRVLVDSGAPAADYDPVSLKLTRDYFFCENLFSPLLGYSSDSELVSELAESFRWSGDEAVFSMRPGGKTGSGAPLDAYDAEFSFKRAFILGGTSYSFLSRMLCGADKLKSLNDACPGLRVRDGGRTLAMKLGAPKPYVFHLLANIAYGVVPRSSVDPATLKIRDYRATSGPYYVDADLGGGNMLLKANPAHHRCAPDMPRRVRIVGSPDYKTNDELLAMLSSGKVDYVMMGVVLKPESKAEFAARHGGYNIHFSRPLRMIYIIFNESGMKRLTREERFFIAKKLRELYPRRRPMTETPDQLFAMEGSLSKRQLEEVASLIKGRRELVIKKRVEGKRLFSYFWLDLEDIAKWLPGAVYADQKPNSERKNPPPLDIFLAGGDIGYQDDVGLVLYYLEQQIFGLGPAETEKWLAAYLAEPAKEARMELLRELQYRTLRDARTLPVGLLPYASLARKPWKFNYPAALAGDHLWRLRRN